jgi:hypothetical protein
MSDKLEKVARAIYQDRNIPSFDDAPHWAKARYRRFARAAISAHESALEEEGFVIVKRDVESLRRASERLEGELTAKALGRAYAARSDKDVEQVPRKSAPHRDDT